MAVDPISVAGFRHIPNALSHAVQVRLRALIEGVIAEAPLFVPSMPKTGRPMSVRMTNCGPLGWVTSRELGYRYQPFHPVTNAPWPEMPPEIKQVWTDFGDDDVDAEACLINWYDPSARLGLHVDRDEQEFSAPVVSVSLGDDAWFRVGGLARRDPTSRIRLRSGDVIVMGGSARLIHHGVDRILPNTGKLLPEPGRYNLTLRRVTPI